MTFPRKSIQNAKGYDIPLYLGDYRLKLDSNENVMGPSPAVIEAIRNITEDKIKFYPAYGELLEKLASHNKTCLNCILPTNGADEAISCIINAFLEPDETILTVTPTFPMSKIYATALGCNYKEVPYTQQWVFPTDELIQHIDNSTKLIIITTPNNPTGEAITEDSLLKIIQAAGDRLILIDETYCNYAEKSFIGLLNEYPNILITRSMSKDFALAGLRFGYIIASEENIGHIKKVISPYSVNNLAITAACAALDDIEHLNKAVAEVKESRKILSEGLRHYAEKVYRSDANFLLVDFGERAEFIYKKLLKSSIKVKNFGKTPKMENCLRIGVPSVKDTQYILDALKPRDLIIFDMDGVLIDTSNSYRNAIQGVYEEFSGKPLSKEQIQHAKNRGGLNNDWDLTMYLLEQDGINLSYNEVIEQFQELYWGNTGDGYILNEELLLDPEAIEQLAHRFDLAIFTGRPKAEAEFALKSRNIDQYFHPIITMDDVPPGRHKPDPWGIFEILRIVDPKKVYYLGDTVDDMFAARQANIDGIGVLPPQDKSEDLRRGLKAHGAVEILENTSDIMNLLWTK